MVFDWLWHYLYIRKKSSKLLQTLFIFFRNIVVIYFMKGNLNKTHAKVVVLVLQIARLPQSDCVLPRIGPSGFRALSQN